MASADSADKEPTTESWDDVDDFKSSGRGTAIVIGLIVAAAVGAILYFVAFKPTYVANRVVFAMEAKTLEGKTLRWWEGTDGDWRRWVPFKKAAAKVGLDPIMHNTKDPEMKLLLDEGIGDADDLVSKTTSALSVGWALRGALTVVAVRPIPDAEVVEVDVKVDMALEGLERGVTIPVVEGDIFHTVADDEDAALSYAVKSLEARYMAPLAVALVAQPELATLIDKPQLTRDEAEIVDAIEPLLGLNRRVQEQTKAREEHIEAVVKEERRIRMDPKARLGEAMADEYMIGPVGANQVLLMTRPRVVRITSKSPKYYYDNGYEQLVLANNEGGERRRLLETYNIFSYPGLSANSKVAVFVLDHHGWSKSLVAMTLPEGADGSETNLRTLLSDKEDYYSSPKVSPDGSKVAYWFKECRRCDEVLKVINTSDGKDNKLLLDPGEYSVSMPSWGADSKFVYLSRGGVVFKIDVATAKMTPFLGGDAPAPLDPSAPKADAETEGEDAKNKDAKNKKDKASKDDGDGDEYEGDPIPSTYAYPSVSPDGKWLAVHETTVDGKKLSVLNIKGWTLKQVADKPIGRPHWSPDSKHLAFRVRYVKSKSDAETWDYEIASVPRDGGPMKLVTTNNDHDSLSGWSGDGQLIYHNQQNREPQSREYFNRIYRVKASK